MQAEVDPNRDQTVAPPCVGISYLMGVEYGACVDGNNSLTWDFVGLVVCISHGRGGRGRGDSLDGGVVLVEFWGNGAPAQEGPPRILPAVVLPVCVGVSYVAPASPIVVPRLKKVIFGWLESYLGNSDRSSVGCAPGDTHAPNPDGGVGYECG
jgi:hypothetical protein